MQLQNWQTKNKVGDTINGFFRQGDDSDLDSDVNPHHVHFLHGTGFSSLCNAKLAEHLPTAWNLWFTDVPGHGGSQQPSISKMPNWPRMSDSVADAVSEVADISKKGKVIGIGHSMGGVLTLLAASRYPERFSRIILFDPVLMHPLIMGFQHFSRVTGLWKRLGFTPDVNKRRSVWPNLQAMREDLSQKSLYRNWDQDAFDYFIQSATRTRENGQVELCCNPSWEASMFGSYPKGLWKHVRKLKVQTDIIIPKNTIPFIPYGARKAIKINKRINVHKYGESHQLLEHCFPMEQPEETARLVSLLIQEK